MYTFYLSHQGYLTFTTFNVYQFLSTNIIIVELIGTIIKYILVCVMSKFNNIDSCIKRKSIHTYLNILVYNTNNRSWE